MTSQIPPPTAKTRTVGSLQANTAKPNSTVAIPSAIMGQIGTVNRSSSPGVTS
jgi:hypothetical protein